MYQDIPLDALKFLNKNKNTRSCLNLHRLQKISLQKIHLRYFYMLFLLLTFNKYVNALCAQYITIFFIFLIEKNNNTQNNNSYS